MRKFHISFIIILTSISLIGIIITQLFWAKNAFILKEEQFHHRVSIALKSIVSQLAECKSDTTIVRSSCQQACAHGAPKVEVVINPLVLDSLIKDEFCCMHINNDYVYAIINKQTHEIIYGTQNNFTNELVASPYSISLSCLYKPDRVHLAIYFLHEEKYTLNALLPWLILSIALLIIVIFGFFYTIVNLLKQKKLSDMKSDFINNVTHEFKTPLATISVASEMLMNPSVIESTEKTQRYAKIIFDENNRLRNQVDQVFQISILDKGQFTLNKKMTDVHRVIESCIDVFRFIVEERKGTIAIQLKAENPYVFADEDHLINMINNLLDNAIKYSTNTLEISISTKIIKNQLLISIEDKGIGISHEDQKHIFKKLYRVSTGNIHNVKGFGWGLFYVKTMAEAHQGSIRVKSELEKGSRFDLYLPIYQISDNKEK